LIWALKNRVKDWKPRHKLILALVPLIIIDLALILTNGMTFTFFGLSFPLWDEYKTTLSFDGKMIFNDGNYTFIINNGVKNLPKTLLIYGLNNTNHVMITASNITDEATNTFKDIKFQDKAKDLFNNPLNFQDNGKDPQQIRVSIPYKR
jgi:hypothetical protein